MRRVCSMVAVAVTLAVGGSAASAALPVVSQSAPAVVRDIGAVGAPAAASANTFTIAHCKGSLYYWNYPGDVAGDDEIAMYDAKFHRQAQNWSWESFHFVDVDTIRGWAVYSTPTGTIYTGVWCQDYGDAPGTWNDGMTGL